jgi:hypothetical protein
VGGTMELGPMELGPEFRERVARVMEERGK